MRRVLFFFLIIIGFVFYTTEVFTVGIDVPFLSQVPPGNWSDTRNCGQTSYLMSHSYINDVGVTAEDIRLIDDWIEQIIGDDKREYSGNYTTISKLIRIATEYGDFNRDDLESHSNSNVDFLINNLEDGNPIIVAVYTNMGTRGNRDTPHFMVLTGIDEGTVYVNDPGKANGKDNAYSMDQFMSAWGRQRHSLLLFKVSSNQDKDIDTNFSIGFNFNQTPSFLSTLWSSNQETAVFAEQSPFLLENVYANINKPLPKVEIPTKDAEPKEENIALPQQEENNTANYSASMIGSPKIVKVLNDANTVELKVEARNNGKSVWNKKSISLNVIGGKAKNAAFTHETWFTKLRPALLDQQIVAPGETGTFTFTLSIPIDQAEITFPLMIVRQDANNNFLQVGNQEYVFNIQRVTSLTEGVQDEKPIGTGGSDPEQENLLKELYEKSKDTTKQVVKKTTDTVKDVANDTVEIIKKVPQFFSGGGGSDNNSDNEETSDDDSNNNNDIDINTDIETPISTPEEGEEENKEEQNEEESVEELLTILEPDHSPYITNANPIVMVGERTAGISSVSIADIDAEVEYSTSSAWLLRFNLTEGERVVELQGKNANGEVVATTSVKYVFDVTVPSVPEVEVSQTGTEPMLVSASWTSVDSLSGIMSYDVERKLLNGGASEWERVVTDSEQTAYSFTANLGEVYAIRVRARDRAYNISPWSGQNEDGETHYVDYEKNIIINEVNWMGTLNRAAGGCRDHEWIELYNPTDEAIDVSGWKIEIENKSGQVSALYPTGIVAPRGYYLLARKAASKSAVLDIPIDHEYQNITLPNEGARLTLKNVASSIVDEVNFTIGWPAGTQTGGPNKNFYRSMERISPNLPGSLSENWRTNGHMPVQGRTNNCGDLFGSPRQPNSGSWLLKSLTFYYADLFDENKTLTLTSENNPYVLDWVTSIPAGYTLRLEPGVKIVGLNKDSYLEVKGNIITNGLSELPVLFTSRQDTGQVGTLHWVTEGEPVAGDWSRIQVVDGGVADINNTNFYYGGYPDSKTLSIFKNIEAANVIRNIDGTVNIQNSLIRQTFIPSKDQQFGATVWTESTLNNPARTSISDTVFDSGWIGYKQRGTNVNSTINNSSFNNFLSPEGPIVLWNSWSTLNNNALTGNAVDAVYLKQLDIASSTKFTSDYPYIVEGLTIKENATVTVDPGTKLRMTTNSFIEVNGTLNAGGTFYNPIDIRGSGEAPWGRIIFNNSNSEVQYTNISGGNHGPLTGQKGGMILSNNSAVTFDNVSFSTAKMSGNLIEGYGSTISVRDSELSFAELQTDPNHKTAGIYVEGGAVTVDNTTFTNMVYGVMAKLGAVVSFLRMTLDHFLNTLSSWWPFDLFSFEPEPEVKPIIEEVLEVPEEQPQVELIEEEVIEEEIVPVVEEDNNGNTDLTDGTDSN